jgi:hypothetical protein
MDIILQGWSTSLFHASQPYVAAFVQGLRQLGWIEGRNLRIDVRWNAGDAALARTYAAQLIGLTPDVILASYCFHDQPDGGPASHQPGGIRRTV